MDEHGAARPQPKESASSALSALKCLKLKTGLYRLWLRTGAQQRAPTNSEPVWTRTNADQFQKFPPTLSLPLEGGGEGGGDFFQLRPCRAVFSA